MSIEWKPVSELPPMDPVPGWEGMEMCPNLLVWMEDPQHIGWAKGACYRSHSRDAEFRADGYHGDWNITHYAIVDRPRGEER